MKIQYCADLHLEFPENKEFLKKHPLISKGEVLIMAGDIVPFRVMDKHQDFFDFVSDNYENTYWIPGNHEYYHSDLSEKQGSFTEKIRDNVVLLNNTSVIMNNTRFIFSTLWTQISKENEWLIRQRLNDFHVIGYNNGLLQPATYNKLHDESLVFIKNELCSSENERKVVVTHHVPTFMNYPEKYKGDALNEAFAVELHDLILESGTEYWIYGHHHTNIADFKIGKTSIITNQLGYVRYNENQGFENKYVEI